MDGASKGTLTLSSSNNPSGTIRLGRSDEIHQQFYGLLDDVAVFNAALSASDVLKLAAAKTLTGMEADLHAGFVFGDGPSAGLPATLTRPVSYVPGAHNVTVSNDRDNAADRELLSLSLVSHMRLPFAQGQIANIDRGFETGSHNGYAAFCYDFSFPNGDINGYVFKASSPGTVAQVSEDDPNTSQGPSNFVTIQQEQGGGEFSDYLHLQQNLAGVNAGQTVSYGADLAEVGISGTGYPHLHQAVTNLGEKTTGEYQI